MKEKTVLVEQERYYLASQWQLMWRKFKKHRLATIATGLLGLLYGVALFADFVSPYGPIDRFPEYAASPPNGIRLFDKDLSRVRPFAYGLNRERDPKTFGNVYVKDEQRRYRVRFLSRGSEYKLWGLLKCNLHLFAPEAGAPLFLFGTDRLGRDLFSRVIFASRISLTIGLVGVSLSMLLGLFLGGLAGYFGGLVDNIIMRAVDLLSSLPTIPLWMALAAAVPRTWTVINTYFAITIILSLISWCPLARIVRGKFLSLREEDFVVAASVSNAKELIIIRRHLLPSFLSYVFVRLTLAIPSMILGETALSFLGLGMQPPAVSWGTLLRDAQSLQVISQQSWMLIPCIFVIITVLMYNFVGDGLRDAADPYR